jgi:hypothetical protein
MKAKLLIIIFITFLFISCSNHELTKEKALSLIVDYYGLGTTEFTSKDKVKITDFKFPATTIALDDQFENYGWAPEKYKALEKQGLIQLDYFPPSGWDNLYGRYKVKLSDGKKEYYIKNRIWKTQTNGNKDQFIFKGYNTNLVDISISSNAKEKNAEALVSFFISDISPVQHIFDPVKTAAFNRTVYFKLYDDGWKIVDNEQSHVKTKSVDNPMHWMGD